MAQTSGPWSDTPLPDNDYSRLMANLAGGFTDSAGGGGANPTFSTDGVGVTIAPFTAGKWGRYHRESEPVTLTPDAPDTQPRYDRVVLQFDPEQKKSGLVVVKGTPGASPRIPTPTNDRDGVFYLPVCTFLVRNATPRLSQMRDDRIFVGNAPMNVSTAFLENGVMEYSPTYGQFFYDRDREGLYRWTPNGTRALDRRTYKSHLRNGPFELLPTNTGRSWEVAKFVVPEVAGTQVIYTAYIGLRFTNARVRQTVNTQLLVDGNGVGVPNSTTSVGGAETGDAYTQTTQVAAVNPLTPGQHSIGVRLAVQGGISPCQIVSVQATIETVTAFG